MAPITCGRDFTLSSACFERTDRFLRLLLHARTTTILTHYFGGGLIDRCECYFVERFRAMSNEEIHHWPGKAPGKNNGRSRPKPEVAPELPSAEPADPIN